MEPRQEPRLYTNENIPRYIIEALKQFKAKLAPTEENENIQREMDRANLDELIKYLDSERELFKRGLTSIETEKKISDFKTAILNFKFDSDDWQTSFVNFRSSIIKPLNTFLEMIKEPPKPEPLFFKPKLPVNEDIIKSEVNDKLIELHNDISVIKKSLHDYIANARVDGSLDEEQFTNLGVLHDILEGFQVALKIKCQPNDALNMINQYKNSITKTELDKNNEFKKQAYDVSLKGMAEVAKLLNELPSNKPKRP